MSEKIRLLEKAIALYTQLYRELSKPVNQQEEKPRGKEEATLAIIDRLAGLTVKLEETEKKEEAFLRALNEVVGKAKFATVASAVALVAAVLALLYAFLL